MTLIRLNFFILLSILSFFSCSKIKNNGNIAFVNEKTSVKVKTETLKSVPKDETLDDQMVFDVSVSMDFMVPRKEQDSTICKTINAFLVDNILDQRPFTTAKEAYKRYIEGKKKEFRESEYEVRYFDHVNGTATYGYNGVINYKMHEDIYCGGAHPSHLTLLYNFNDQTGNAITTWDVFKDEKEEELKLMLTDRLMQNLNVKSMKELNELGYLEMVDIFVPTNFTMGEDSILFYFNEYDIAPYACGPSEVAFSWDEVKELLR